MKIVSYNIHRASDCNNINTLNEIINYLSNLNCDIICLQEVLYHQFISIKSKLKMDGIFAINVNKPNLKYGICTLSKFKIENSTHLLLESKKEQRGILNIQIVICKDGMSIINTHLGLDKDERNTQINQILDYINTLPKRVILCGDFNEQNIFISNFKDSAILTNKYHIETFDKTKSRIDYIFLSEDIKIYEYTVEKINLSDHYPVIIKV